MKDILNGFLTMWIASVLLVLFGWLIITLGWKPPKLPEFALGAILGMATLMLCAYILAEKLTKGIQ